MLNSLYSYRDFSGVSLVDRPAKEFNHSDIIQSSFYQEASIEDDGDPQVAIFPPDIRGVTFRRCCLDNVLIPPGNTVITRGDDSCSVLRIRAQNDLCDWITDAAGEPLEPVTRNDFERFSISVDPRDIPARRLEMNRIDQSQNQHEIGA